VLRRYFSQDGETLMVATTIYPAGRYSFSFAIDLPGVWCVFERSDSRFA
jgi:hypothetical protein